MPRLAAFVLAASLAAPGALAQPDPARAAYEEGVAALEESRFQEAALALERSLALREVPVVLYNLAVAYRGLGRYRDAIGLFDRYLQAAEGTADAARLDAIRAERALLLGSLAHLSPIRVTPANALLSVDGREPRPAPETLELDPGDHVLEWTAPLHRARRETVTTPPGTRTPVQVALDPIREGWLHVDASSSVVAIDIDGARAGMGRAERELPVGEHTVSLRAEGYRPLDRRVVVAPGATVRLVLTLERRRAWVLPAVIAGGAALVAGAVVLGVVLGTREDVPALRDGTWGTYRE